MTTKDCGQHGHDCDEPTAKPFIIAVIAFLAVVGFVIFLVWAILHPTKPRFILQDATLYAFNISDSDQSTITSKLQVTLYSRNPNDKIGIYYQKVDVYASYRNQQVTLATLLPTTYQGHKDITIWSPILAGDSVPVAPYFSPVLSQDVNAGVVLLNIKVDGWVKWKVGTWISGKYRLQVNCPAYMKFGNRDTGLATGPAIKYQLVQVCTVDV